MTELRTGASAIDGRGARPAEPTLGGLVASASKDVSSLVHHEIELAKAELRQDVKRAVAGAGMFGVAAVLGLLAAFAVTIAFGYALVALGLHEAWAFLIVTAVYLLLAGVLAFIGLRQVKKVKPPERTVATTKETVAVLKGARG